MKANFKHFHMKNAFKFAVVAAMFSVLVACGGKTQETTTTQDSTAVEAPIEAPADSTAAPAQDSTAAPAQ